VVNKKWYESLPKDLQELIDKDAAAQDSAIVPFAAESLKDDFTAWTTGGGELINLPPDEKASLMKTLSSVGADVSSTKPVLGAAYKIVTEAAQRARQAASQ
jgi:TRAP-type C4-dicarboxylate transport system substrate-binding protein